MEGVIAMKGRNIIYIVISALCIIAIVLGVYYQIFGEKNNMTNTISNEVNTNIDENGVVDPEVLKEEFNNLFANSFDSQGYPTAEIVKIQDLEEQDVIYAAYNIKAEQDEKYSVNINLPVFNVSGDVATEFNQTTQTIFANKASEILGNSQVYTIYDVEYTAYLNENILSMVIKSTLKEGSNPQRVIVQTYNYNVTTNQKVSLNEILQEKGIELREVNKKIEKQVEEANKRAEAVSQALAQTGQTIYKRDINNAMYVTDNVSHFFLGPNGQIYIIYPYGNANFTSEIDIIKI